MVMVYTLFPNDENIYYIIMFLYLLSGCCCATFCNFQRIEVKIEDSYKAIGRARDDQVSIVAANNRGHVPLTMAREGNCVIGMNARSFARHGFCCPRACDCLAFLAVEHDDIRTACPATNRVRCHRNACNIAILPAGEGPAENRARH